MGFKGFIFDLDGTLISSVSAHQQAYATAFAKFNQTFCSKIFHQTFGQNIKSWAPKMGISSAELISDIQREKTLLFPHYVNQVEINARMMRIVEKLSERGKIALCTSASRSTVQNIFKVFGLEDLFDVVVTGSDITHHKPDPEAYFSCLTKLKLHASECLAFEDSLSGTTAAKNAKIRCIDVSKSNLNSNRKSKSLIKQNDIPIRFFSGGSGSTTYISRPQDGTLIVTKIADRFTASRLRDQSDWLKAHSNLSHLPKVLSDHEENQIYSYSMHFLNQLAPLSKYLSRNPDKDQSKLIEKIVGIVTNQPHLRESELIDTQLLLNYINQKLIPTIHGSIQDPASSDTISLLSRISKDSTLVTALTRTRKTMIHGDLSAENILTDGEQIIFIDPNPNQTIHCVEVDLGKLRMSLHSRYEEFRFLRSCMDFSPVIEPQIQRTYDETCLKILGSEACTRIQFHEAAHLIRAIPYLLQAKRAGAAKIALLKCQDLLNAIVTASNEIPLNNQKPTLENQKI